MNRDRRKRLAEIDHEELGRLLEAYEVARAALADCCSEIRDTLADIVSEEQEALENLPESLQEGDRGQDMTNNIEILEQVIGDLETIIDMDNTTEFSADDVAGLTSL